MGWKSTVEISRDRALQEISELLYDADDETLASVLEDLIDGATNRGVYEGALGGANFAVKNS